MRVGRLDVRRYPAPCGLRRPHLIWSRWVAGVCLVRVQATWARR